MSVYLKDLIHIPEHVHSGDFVLKLTEGVDDPGPTLNNYVITNQLLGSFDKALGFIRQGLAGRSGKAVYLHGSFGSGKSHFMAVLYQLLQHHSDARAIPELGEIIAKHDAWLEGKNLLTAPFHMMDAVSMEAGILGGYAAYIQRIKPDAPAPGVYLADKLFQDAQRLRGKMGDKAFFAELNARVAGAQDTGWGGLQGETWDADSFEAVVQGRTDGNARSDLVGALVSSWFSSMGDLAHAEGGGFVPLDEGLSIICRHAQSLGYDGLVLFLDELILWLASKIGDKTFIAENVSKISKLVESTHGARPLPLISFIARQRDLRDFIDESDLGVDKQSLSDALKHWEGRFDVVNLEDRNLPVIIQKRVLKPRNEAAAQQIDKAFEETVSQRQEVLDVLMTREADRTMFRAMYPFSPALVEALIGLSSVLQRERTALRLLYKLLSDKRDSLVLGKVVPVGDLYDVFESDINPLNHEMGKRFDTARKLYRNKLAPILEKTHGPVEGLPSDDPKRRAFESDAGLIKTLLLAALVPEVPCFRNMSPQRLAALNHGTIRSPLPNQEGSTVKGKIRQWSGPAEGMLRIDDKGHISLRISDVNTASILEKAEVGDSEGQRRRLVRELLYERLGVPLVESFEQDIPITWRGTERFYQLYFGNIRTMRDDELQNDGGQWRVVVDYPFDDRDHSPNDDLSRLERFRQSHERTRTLCWLPSFFSEGLQRDLGTLVKLNYLLAGDDRFNQAAAHYNSRDRDTARSQMENQRNQIRRDIEDALDALYGIGRLQPHMVGRELEGDEHLVSLEPAFKPRKPVAANLKDGLAGLLDQGLAYLYPDHPEFEVEVKASVLRKVYEEVRRAFDAPDHRIEVDKSLRPLMRQIANPLRLGEQGEQPFVLGDYWLNHFSKCIARDKAPSLTVAQMRAYTDEPKPRGLPSLVQDMLIMLFAERDDRVFKVEGVGFTPELGKALPDRMMLEKQPLPEPNDWAAAVKTAGCIWGGEAFPEVCSAANVARMESEVRGRIRDDQAKVKAMVSALKTRAGLLKQNVSDWDRMRTGDAALTLLNRLDAASAGGMTAILAATRPPTSLQALARAVNSAVDVSRALERAKWHLLDKVWSLDEPAAKEIRKRVLEGLARDEHVRRLQDVLAKAEADTAEMLIALNKRVTPNPKPEPIKPPKVIQPPIVSKLPKRGERQGLNFQQARDFLDELASQPGGDLSIHITWEAAS